MPLDRRRRRPPLTIKQIAARVHLSSSTIVGVIDRLAEKELVRRERGLKDRRIVNVLATEAGRELAGSAPSPLQDRLADALMGIPELERVAIALSLERIVDLMEAGGIEAAPLLSVGPVDPPGANRTPDQTKERP